ncbi:MAG: hypothetical protein RIM72_21200 [Alphaproteobacteria bacterium]
MGSHFSSWDGVEGAIYMGANTSWEVIWVVVAAACCVLALVIGSRHEMDAYKRQNDK